MKTTLLPIIGLEIHVQLNTKSKMFCACDNRGENLPPNTAICQICTGQPGTLPVANLEGIQKTVKAALALNCRIPEYSKFDRKNYFYPDLPKGYQISQYDLPIGANGHLSLHNNGEEKTVRIQRIHLEEDAAKNFHSPDGQFTLVDYNRAGTPLMEIVTEPDMRSPEEAKAFLQELRLIMRYLDISSADMEKGHLRCDANINLWELNNKEEKIAATPIVEVKNMNSFRSLERAMAYEIKRQEKEYTETKITMNEAPKTTRGWDNEKGVTQSQRTKEEAHDYRYFPEPDLPALHFSVSGKDNIDPEKIRKSLPELPHKKRKRFEQEYGITPSDSKILASDKELLEYSEKVISELQEWITSHHPEIEGTKEEVWKNTRAALVKTAMNWLIHKLMKYLNKDAISIHECRITPENFAEFSNLVFQKTMNASIAQKVLDSMYTTGKDPSSILEEENLGGETRDTDLDTILKSVIAQNPQAVENYKKGKTNAIMFLIGQIMKETRGKSNPESVKKLLEKKLRRI